MFQPRNANTPLVRNNGGAPTHPVAAHAETLPSLSADGRRIKGDLRDYEPDQTWKDEVTKRIDAAFESLLNDANKTHGGRSKEQEMRHPTNLMKKSSLRFEEEWRQATATIVALKKREYDYALAEERGSRRVASSEIKAPVSEHRATTSDRTAKRDVPSYEPDEQWKRDLRRRIDVAFEDRVNRVQEHSGAQLRRFAVTQEDRQRLEGEYNKAMGAINDEKWEQYRFELAKERSSRLWAIQSPSAERHPDHRPPFEPPPKPLQQPRPPVVPLKNFEDSPRSRARSPKRRVTVEDVPDDESIRSYLPDDGPILDLRVKPVDPQTQGVGIKRKRPTQTPHVGPDRNHVPRTVPREDTPKVKPAKRKTEAEIRFGGRKIPVLNNIYES